MKLLLGTQDKVLLYLLKSKLEENQIDTLIKNEVPPLAGELPPAVFWPELWILNDEDYLNAKKILDEDLEEIAHPGPSWTCSQCHEILEGQFEVCWKCGASRS
jgi:hypothetical protein